MVQGQSTRNCVVIQYLTSNSKCLQNVLDFDFMADFQGLSNLSDEIQKISVYWAIHVIDNTCIEKFQMRLQKGLILFCTFKLVKNEHGIRKIILF